MKQKNIVIISLFVLLLERMNIKLNFYKILQFYLWLIFNIFTRLVITNIYFHKLVTQGFDHVWNYENNRVVSS